MQKQKFWLISGCKVGHSVPIGIKLELDVWHHLRNVNTKFQTNISKHVEINPGKLRKIQNGQNYRQNSDISFLQKTELMSRSIQWATYVPNLENLSWFVKPWLLERSLITLGCKLGQSDPIVMTLKLDMSCHLLNVYTKFQINISKCDEKSRKSLDGRTDRWREGRTDGRTVTQYNTSVFQTGV